jgi:hypothetical protein
MSLLIHIITSYVILSTTVVIFWDLFHPRFGSFPCFDYYKMEQLLQILHTIFTRFTQVSII